MIRLDILFLGGFVIVVKVIQLGHEFRQYPVFKEPHNFYLSFCRRLPIDIYMLTPVLSYKQDDRMNRIKKHAAERRADSAEPPIPLLRKPLPGDILAAESGILNSF